MRHRLRFPGPAMVVALVALFVALSGTAVAAGVPALAKRALTADKAKVANTAKVADNAKKLEGKTSAALLATANTAAKQAAESAASSAAQQPGPASTAAGLITIKTAAWNLNKGTGTNFTATCDPGQKVVGGGWGDPGDWSASFQSLPTADGAGWTVNIYTPSFAPAAQSGTVYAMCLK